MTLLTTFVTAGIQVISYSAGSPPVVETVATAVRSELFPASRIEVLSVEGKPAPGAFVVGVAENGRWDVPSGAPKEGPWMFAQLDPDGSGRLVASEPGFLYTIYAEMRRLIETDNAKSLEIGVLIEPAFDWITGREDVHMSRLHYLKRRTDPVTFDDIEASFREAARLGCTHVVVNEPTSPHPFETGPEGEIYYRFYAYALDLDQYVETRLNTGTYPASRLESNLTLMKRLAALAVKYGLTPGMYVANPRSVPESLLGRHPYLRGARIDHTYRAFEPRYTLTLAHPVVRWHYAEMLRKLLAEVPELGFLITLVNDSGSGFEYTASLYPGRNGGPYIVREWRPDDEIAAKAAANVIRYYRLMRDTAREINPDFRILTGLKNIAEEAEIILDGLDDGLDLRMRSQRSDYDENWYSTMRDFRARGSEMTGQGLAKGNPIIIGVPAPWKVLETLSELESAGYRYVGLDVDPIFLSESDVNREMLRLVQLRRSKEAESAIAEFAASQVGGDLAPSFVDIWRKSDAAVRSTPQLALYGGQGFVWYRFWVRPFVPNIGAIPETDRAYYQDHMLTIFNNPHNVDFGADALWTIHTPEEAAGYVRQFDTEVFAPLDEAISASRAVLDGGSISEHAQSAVTDLRDRLRAYRSYCRTLRNTAAWIADVHGYMDAETDSARTEHRAKVDELVADELVNARDLLDLWESSSVDVIPITEGAETMHTYGLNFGDLLRRKIALMETYGDREPYIDPNYMWRMPSGSDLSDVEYLGY